MMTYFAADGSYGDADALVVVDTSAWSEEQWATVEGCCDGDRAYVARSIAMERGDDYHGGA